ncbi:MAG: hypothetical protein Q8K74_05495 [Candidatus Nitrotoga sp.]|nr:hypothetical protein [Candidatus Nitrotoga sp.]MDP1855489.1 hypothetical protein [Candidatus Nitrotoga sp.]
MEVSGISTLSTILKRPIELRSDALAQRREMAAELQTNCQKLAIFLKKTLRIDKQANEVDFEAAEKRIMNLMDDLKQVGSTFQEEESPVLWHLAIDMRFKDFAKNCADFYQLILNLKQLLNENISDSSALKALCKEEGLLKVTEAWQGELETMLGRVNQEYMKVMAIKFSW